MIRVKVLTADLMEWLDSQERGTLFPKITEDAIIVDVKSNSYDTTFVIKEGR